MSNDNQENKTLEPGHSDGGCGEAPSGKEINAEGSSKQKPLPSPFDPEHLKLSQDFTEEFSAKKHLLAVPARKPSREKYVRTHPEEDYWLQTGVIELKEEGELYLVAPDLWSTLDGSESTFSARMLALATDRQGGVFFWPLRLPRSDGRKDLWAATALEAATIAREHWVRVTANMSLGAYDVYEAPPGLPEPEFPDLTMEGVLEVAFRDRYIDSLDHPILKQLRGEI